MSRQTQRRHDYGRKKIWCVHCNIEKSKIAEQEAQAKIQQIQQKGQVEAQKGQMDLALKQLQLMYIGLNPAMMPCHTISFM